MIGILGNKTGYFDDGHFLLECSFNLLMSNIGCGLLQKVQVLYALMYDINCLLRYEFALKVLRLWRIFPNSESSSIQWNIESLYFISCFAIHKWKYSNILKAWTMIQTQQNWKYHNGKIYLFTFTTITTLPET